MKSAIPVTAMCAVFYLAAYVQFPQPNQSPAIRGGGEQGENARLAMDFIDTLFNRCDYGAARTMCHDQFAFETTISGLGRERTEWNGFIELAKALHEKHLDYRLKARGWGEMGGIVKFEWDGGVYANGMPVMYELWDETLQNHPLRGKTIGIGLMKIRDGKIAGLCFSMHEYSTKIQ